MKVIVTIIVSLFAASAVSLRAADAKANWDANCAQCQGKTGAADTKRGKQLNGKDLTAPKVHSAFTNAKATETIKSGVKEGRKTTMKAFGDHLSDDDFKA